MRTGGRLSPHRAGVIKVAGSAGGPSARDARVIEAAAEAHHRTGAPILTHCEAGTGALEQVALLEDLGVDPSSSAKAPTPARPVGSRGPTTLSTWLSVTCDGRRPGPSAAPPARGPGPGLAMGQDRRPGPAVRLGGGGEDAASRVDGPPGCRRP